MTRDQKRQIANLVLLHGYDNCLEFYDELIDGAPEGTFPPYDEMSATLTAWHRAIIVIADKVVHAS